MPGAERGGEADDAIRPCTRTSEVTNASERAWLKPSAARRRVEGVVHEATAPDAHQRLAGVVARQLPGLGNRGRGAHRIPPRSGTQTSIADGSISTDSFLTFSRSPPSSSYRTLRSNVIFDPRAHVSLARTETCRDEPAAVRASVRAHSSIPSAVTTPSSSSPSSGRASSKTSTPAKSVPTLPNEDAARLAVEPGRAVDPDLRLERLAAEARSCPVQT